MNSSIRIIRMLLEIGNEWNRRWLNEWSEKGSPRYINMSKVDGITSKQDIRYLIRSITYMNPTKKIALNRISPTPQMRYCCSKFKKVIRSLKKERSYFGHPLQRSSYRAYNNPLKLSKVEVRI